MTTMRASGQRLCQMVHDVGLRPGTEEHLGELADAHAHCLQGSSFYSTNLAIGVITLALG